jgi:Fe-S cluster assembly protein SufD
MQAQDTVVRDRFNRLFQDYRNKLNGHSGHPLAQFRQQAYDVLQDQPFPTRRDEDWKYSGAVIGRMLETDYQTAKGAAFTAADLAGLDLPELDAVRVVFVNGILHEELSQLDELPAGLRLERVAQAIEEESTAAWLNELAARKGGTGVNAFLPLNQTFAAHGLLIAAEKNAAVEKPVHCIYVNTAEGEAHFSHPQLFLKTNTSSELTVVETHLSTDPALSYFTNAATWVDVAANSHLHHYRFQLESRSALHINNIVGRQERDSVYSAYGIDLGGKATRNNLSMEHLGPGLTTNLYGVYLAAGQQQIDNQTFLDHAVPHCQSNELYKGVVTDYARGVFNGKVLVRRDAQKTNAFQQSSSLVLSRNAAMDAKPQLEIFADDVRCSHGATIGQLDESSVFYLRSRGITEAGARRLLQQAFLGEVLENFAHDALAEWGRTRINNKLAEA